MILRFLFLIFLVGNVYAQETCCIEKDIAAAFLPHMTYSHDWPDKFPIVLNIPALEFIGSSSGIDGQQTAVAWKSKLNPADARQLVADTLLQEDWLAVPQGSDMQAYFQLGFIPHHQITIGNHHQFCRDRAGQLSVQARRTDIGNIITLSHHNNQRTRDCAAMIAVQRVRPVLQRGLMRYLPALKLPEAVKTPQHGGGGRGGGSEDAHASISVETTLSPGALTATFEKQMTAQDWQFDTNFQGTATSGHIWRREVDGLKLICLLTAYSSGNDKVKLRMHVEPI